MLISWKLNHPSRHTYATKHTYAGFYGVRLINYGFVSSHQSNDIKGRNYTYNMYMHLVKGYNQIATHIPANLLS